MKSYSLPQWGLLGIDYTNSTSRTRTLGVGSAVRKFNNLAVPGMGNVWFGKQIFIAALGIAVAEKSRQHKNVQNIEVANAIEALACWKSFIENNWSSDKRLRGINKLRDVTDISFSTFHKRGFYVTQPMRMGTVQLLPSLGLVNTDTHRFNGFSLSDVGNMLVNEVCTDYYGDDQDKADRFIQHLVKWVINKQNFTYNAENYNILSPLVKMNSKSRTLVKNLILKQGTIWETDRRKAILNWVDTSLTIKNNNLKWDHKPGCISEDHWKDLKAGALFFKTRSTALALLDEIEEHILRNTNDNKLNVAETMKLFGKERLDLRNAADSFLNMQYDPSPNGDATVFCRECVDMKSLAKQIVLRDGVGLRLKGEFIIPGPACKGKKNQSAINEDEPDPDLLRGTGTNLPEFISTRVHRMHLISQDLKGNTKQWL